MFTCKLTWTLHRRQSWKAPQHRPEISHFCRLQTNKNLSGGRLPEKGTDEAGDIQDFRKAVTHFFHFTKQWKHSSWETYRSSWERKEKKNLKTIAPLEKEKDRGKQLWLRAPENLAISPRWDCVNLNGYVLEQQKAHSFHRRKCGRRQQWLY